MTEPPLKPPAPPAGYSVGYGKPPLHTRFPKGQSGNRKGRPSKQKSGSASIAEALGITMSATINGKPRSMSTFEAYVRGLVADATKKSGKLSSAIAFMKLCEEHDLIRRSAHEFSGGVIRVPKEFQIDEYILRWTIEGPPPWADGWHSGLCGGKRYAREADPNGNFYLEEIRAEKEEEERETKLRSVGGGDRGGGRL